VNPPIGYYGQLLVLMSNLDNPRAALPGAELLPLLRATEAEAATLDLRAAEESGEVERVIVHLQALLTRGIDSMIALQEAHSRTRNADRVPESDDDWFSQLTPVMAAPGVADFCFAGILETRRAARELEAAELPDERLVAAETACRKLRRGLRAVLTAARQELTTTPPPPELDPHEAHDLQSSLAVRRVYSTFRRSLQRPTDDSFEAVLTALRYAVGALATLVAAPEYAEIRTSDRALLRRLRERALEWARHQGPREVGLQLIEDLWTSADLLRGINQRQELRAHDAALIQELTSFPATDPIAWFKRLEALTGLDDALDALIERGRRSLSTELVREATARVTALR
jgi:hypothetical protein